MKLGMMRRKVVSFSALVAAGWLAGPGCGQDAARVQGGPSGPGGSGGPDSTSCGQMLFAGVQPSLGLCRTCHVAGGVADTPGGSLFRLSKNPDEDATQLHDSWVALGKNDHGKSLLLTMPSGTSGRSHPGGTPWPVGSAPYHAMDLLLQSYDDPSLCAQGGGGAGAPLPPLLGSAHGGHIWSSFCQGKPDDTPLPIDPRTLVQPGVNAGKATYFNAYWVDCNDPAAPHSSPTTCGEYRARYARGQAIMEGGTMAFFGGDYPDALLSFTADMYNNLWKQWGLSARPTDFDQRVADRWGMAIGPQRNPYPLPGEDPNKTNGGSGQLPVAMVQLRNADGTYTGKMSFNCHWCHSGQVGLPGEGPGLGMTYGTNSLPELGEVFRSALYGLGALAPIAANKVRGTGDILLYPAIMAVDIDRASHYNSSIFNAPSEGTVDFPTWWNDGHRTRRFHDGSFAMSDSRPVMGFFIPILSASHLADLAGGRQWISQRDQDVQTWIESLQSPIYPEAIDTELAEAGAILFHNKDLWAPELANRIPRPVGGNGSCAGCHGVYSPRYVNDPSYLDTPALEGIASYVVSPDVIGTDPARSNALNDGLKEGLRWTWWAYGTNDTPGQCFGVPDKGGYLAPALYGVWASAPYFHNGSVPNIWEVLKPSDRTPIWRRKSAPAPVSAPNRFMGYDTSFYRAYDRQKLGWQYDSLDCGAAGTSPYLDCTPGAVETSPILQQILTQGFMSLWFTWNFSQPPPYTAADLENRKIYNTHKYSQGNQGHEFTSVLTDTERKALLEYLKTL